MRRWELPEGTPGSDGVTGWIYPCEENRNTLDSAAPASWLYPEHSQVTPHRDVPTWSPVLDQPGSLPPLPFTPSLLQPGLHLLPAWICLLGTICMGPAPQGTSGHHWIGEGAGPGAAGGTWQLPEGWAVSCHCHSAGDAGSEVERSRCTQTGAGFPLLGNLERLSCLGFGLWVFQTVDSHPAKISLQRMCTADV